eukprot:TRINITY_DN1136_c0_g1_i1.p1 TRINITY_DN1136_c0_g1~~TRINITY_DN1136_c0_g1_i1.p1  ORF type:complete len:255 (+),score=91.38 TRINITY_DN1136_c0_g1_i1:248-1012(+)
MSQPFSKQKGGQRGKSLSETVNVAKKYANGDDAAFVQALERTNYFKKYSSSPVPNALEILQQIVKNTKELYDTAPPQEKRKYLSWLSVCMTRKNLIDLGWNVCNTSFAAANRYAKEERKRKEDLSERKNRRKRRKEEVDGTLGEEEYDDEGLEVEGITGDEEELTSSGAVSVTVTGVVGEDGEVHEYREEVLRDGEDGVRALVNEVREQVREEGLGLGIPQEVLREEGISQEVIQQQLQQQQPQDVQLPHLEAK